MDVLNWFLCDFKLKNVTFAIGLMIQLLTKDKSINIICNKCDKRFKTTSGLDYHNSSIHEGKYFSCDQCD